MRYLYVYVFIFQENLAGNLFLYKCSLNYQSMRSSLLNICRTLYSLCRGVTMNTGVMPTKPAHPAFIYKKYMTNIAERGATHIWCNITDTMSKRLTSFDSKFTIFPEAVSPNADLLSLKVWKQNYSFNLIGLPI